MITWSVILQISREVATVFFQSVVILHDRIPISISRQQPLSPSHLSLDIVPPEARYLWIISRFCLDFTFYPCLDTNVNNTPSMLAFLPTINVTAVVSVALVTRPLFEDNRWSVEWISAVAILARNER